MALAAKRHGASAAPPLRWPVDRVLPGILPTRETCPWPEGGHPHRWSHCAREEHQGRGHEIGDSRHIAARHPRRLAVTIPRPITEAEGNKRLSRGVEGALLSWRPGLHTFSVCGTGHPPLISAFSTLMNLTRAMISWVSHGYVPRHDLHSVGCVGMAFSNFICVCSNSRHMAWLLCSGGNFTGFFLRGLFFWFLGTGQRHGHSDFGHAYFPLLLLSFKPTRRLVVACVHWGLRRSADMDLGNIPDTFDAA